LNEPAALRTGCRSIAVPARGNLLKRGDIVDGAYFVADGAVRVYYVDADGQEGTLYSVTRGESCILAVNALFSGLMYPAWADAGAKGARLVRLEAAVARELVATEPAFTQQMFAQISGRLFGLLRGLEHALRLPLASRLILALLENCDEAGGVRSSHQLLALDLGTSREVVSRLLRALAADGLVQNGYRRIQLLDPAELRRRIG